jgi:hypothetical protein
MLNGPKLTLIDRPRGCGVHPRGRAEIRRAIANELARSALDTFLERESDRTGLPIRFAIRKYLNVVADAIISAADNSITVVRLTIPATAEPEGEPAEEPMGEPAEEPTGEPAQAPEARPITRSGAKAGAKAGAKPSTKPRAKASRTVLLRNTTAARAARARNTSMQMAAVDLVSELYAAWCIDSFAIAHLLDFFCGTGCKYRARAASAMARYARYCKGAAREELETIMSGARGMEADGEETPETVLRCVRDSREADSDECADSIRALVVEGDTVDRLDSAVQACEQFVRDNLVIDAASGAGIGTDHTGPASDTEPGGAVVACMPLGPKGASVARVMCNYGSAVIYLAQLVYAAGDLDSGLGDELDVTPALYCDALFTKDGTIQWRTRTDITRCTDIGAIARAARHAGQLRLALFSHLPIECGRVGPVATGAKRSPMLF